MSNLNNSYAADSEIKNDNSLENHQQLQRLFFRIIPFWPLILLLILTGLSTAYLLLRYATPLYQVKARLVVNDDTQEKSANLQEIFTLEIGRAHV